MVVWGGHLGGVAISLVDLKMVRFWFQGLEPRTRTSGSAVLRYNNRTAPRFYAVLTRFEPHGAAIA
jgi:hypothetical protein